MVCKVLRNVNIYDPHSNIVGKLLVYDITNYILLWILGNSNNNCICKSLFLATQLDTGSFQEKF